MCTGCSFADRDSGDRTIAGTLLPSLVTRPGTAAPAKQAGLLFHQNAGGVGWGKRGGPRFQEHWIISSLCTSPVYAKQAKTRKPANCKKSCLGKCRRARAGSGFSALGHPRPGQSNTCGCPVRRRGQRGLELLHESSSLNINKKTQN